MLQRTGAETLPISRAEIGSVAPAVATVWRFCGFEFDARGGQLQGPDGAPIALRPKAEALLRALLAQPRRLFSRDELIARLWPTAVVTDDSLVQCVGELRSALGDRSQTLIRTVPRRGYRLDADVVAVADVPVAGPRSDDAGTSGPATSAPATPPKRSPTRAWRLLAMAGALASAGAVLVRPMLAPVRIDDEIAARHVVAVMPFAAAGDDPALRRVADAVADDIAAQIATRVGMVSIGRATTSEYADPSPSLDRLAGALKATYVVSGQVVPALEQAAAVDVQIVAIANRAVVWAGRFSQARAHLGESDIGVEVVSALRARFSDIDSALALRPGHEPDAADLTLLGWYELDRRRSRADIRQARSRFEQAHRVDPESIIALNGLAATYLIERAERYPLTASDITESERLIDLARSLAPNDGTALLSWSNLQLLKGRPELALPALEKASRLVPSYAAGPLFIAQALLMLGRIDEVEPYADRAIRLAARDPPKLSAAYLVAAEAALMRGDDERARDLARRAVAARPANAPAQAVLAAVDALAGRDEQARAAMATFLSLAPGMTVARYDELRPSSHPAFIAQRERLYQGLRIAGLPPG